MAPASHSVILDRREFITRTALGAAALVLPGCRTAAQRTSVERGAMFVSLPPWAVARNVPWPEQARLAARVGYQGIDWAFDAAKSAGVNATRALLAELGIVPTIVNLPMKATLGADDAAFDAQLAGLAGDAAFSAAIGCSRFQLVLGPTRLPGQTMEVRWEQMRRRLARIGETIAPHGMRLGVEFLGPLYFRTRQQPGAAAPSVPFVWTLRETLALAVASAPNVGVTLDAWHWHHSGGTVADIRAADASRIVHVHVSDARAMPADEVRDDMRLLPGEGVIDLIGFFGALKAIGYRGGVAPETIGPRIPDTMSPEESARIALEATTAVMRKAGVA
jgi:sugar phosphate isomerase/epimerase